MTTKVKVRLRSGNSGLARRLQTLGNVLQKSCSGFSRFEGGEICGQLDSRHGCTRIAETLLGHRRCREAWTEYCQVEAAYADQHQAIAKIVAGMHIVSGAMQQFANVSDNVGIGVDAQNAFSAEAGCSIGARAR